MTSEVMDPGSPVRHAPPAMSTPPSTKEHHMSDMALPVQQASTSDGGTLLRVALKLDAVVTGTNGLAYLVVAAPLEDLLGLDAALLRGAGAFLVVFAAAVLVAGTRPAIPRRAAAAIVAANALWAIDGIVSAVAGWGTPTTAGTVWIVAQAVTVAAFAELQLAGLRRAGR
jgi:hypothetical protein